jgi:parallel beta-helix repeat protein
MVDVTPYHPEMEHGVHMIRRDVGLRMAYAERGPIFIHDDSDFITYGFPGTGEENTPYVIEGYNITNSNFELIVVENTEAFFVIKNNCLNSIASELDAIYLRNAKNGRVYNNTILNNRHGIFLDTGCDELNVSNNRISHSSESGIRVNASTNIGVFHNVINQNTYNGIWVNSSSQ